MTEKAFALVGGRIITPAEDISSGTLVIRGTKIDEIGRAEQVIPPPGVNVVDVSGKIVCPGFVEVHIHGGQGITMGSPEGSQHSPTSTIAGDIQALSERLPESGITSFIPTFSTLPFNTSLQILEEAPEAMHNANQGAEILGLQMEGPYFNPSPKGPYDRYPPGGAQPTDYFRVPSISELHQMMELSQGHLRMMCISPEVDGAVELIREMKCLGIVASGAHSFASHDETLAAVEAGMTTVTHMYNGMRRQDHREPGIIEAALVCYEITLQIIADGIHVHPPAFEISLRCKGKDKVAITTDNTSFAGLPNGLYKDELGRQLEKTDDYVRIVDSVLAGSVMLMNRQLRTLTKRMDVSLQDAIYMATIVPARIIGAEAKGSLEPEKDADIIVIDDDLNVHLAYCRGVLAYSSDSKD